MYYIPCGFAAISTYCVISNWKLCRRATADYDFPEIVYRKQMSRAFGLLVLECLTLAFGNAASPAAGGLLIATILCFVSAPVMRDYTKRKYFGVVKQQSNKTDD